MAMVSADGSSRSADSQPQSVGLVWGLAATRRSVCIHQMNRVNSCNDCHDDSTINIVSNIVIILLCGDVSLRCHLFTLFKLVCVCRRNVGNKEEGRHQETEIVW